MSQHLDLAKIHEDLPQWVEQEIERRGLSWRAVQRGELWQSDRLPFRNLDELQQFVICSDPVRFCECMLVRRDEAGRPPWRLFDYQKPSMRLGGHKIHQDGAEVGKTLEVVGLVLHRLVWETGDQLVGAPLDGHLGDAWDEIQSQIGLNPLLAQMVDAKGTRIKPYRRLQFTNGNVCYFRPAGSDGTPFRGVHVKVAAYLDEAAKMPGDEAWANFFRACKPQCSISIYSVPDGRRDTRYYSLCQASPEVDVFQPPEISHDPDDEGPRRFVRIRWPKTLMPEPFWSPSRQREFEEQYGGSDTSAYLQNVLGEHGEPTTSVFPWNKLRPCVKYLPDYVALKIDGSNPNVYRVTASRLDPDHQITDRLGADDKRPAQEPMRRLDERTLPIHVINGNLDVTTGTWSKGLAARIAAWEKLFREFFPPALGKLVIGADFGFVSDPSEVLVGRIDGERTDWIARLQFQHCDCDRQVEALLALDAVFQPSCGWGLEATGDGKVVPQLLSSRAYQGRHLSTSQFVMNAKTTERDEHGEERTDDQGKPLRTTYKELGYNRLVPAMQRQRLGVPYDPDLLSQFTNHQVRVLPSGERQHIHTRKGDHLVEAARAMELRKRQVELGDLDRGPITYAAPKTSRNRELHRLGTRIFTQFGRGRGLKDLFK